MAIDFLPVVPPAGGTLKNGRLNACQLTSVFFPGLGHGSLYPFAARAWAAMATICAAETGGVLTTTPGGAYRTFAQQLAAFDQRYTPTYLPVRNVTHGQRTYNGKRYWLRRGFAPAASPGTSNHGLAIAVDCAWHVGGGKPAAGVTSNAKGWAWLQANAVSFGFSWEGARPGQPGWEPWHLRHVLGDDVSQRVKDIEAFFGGAK